MRLIVRRHDPVADLHQDTEYTDWDAVERFAHAFARTVTAGGASGMTGAAAAKTVVVGYDASDRSKRALDWALQRAGTGGRVVVVDATRPSDRLAHPSVEAMLHDRVPQRNAVSVELVFLDPLPRSAGRSWSARSPRTSRRRRCSRPRATPTTLDEIVVGHRDRSRVRQLSGSVSAALLRQRDRPAIVVVPERLRAVERHRRADPRPRRVRVDRQLTAGQQHPLAHPGEAVPGRRRGRLKARAVV